MDSNDLSLQEILDTFVDNLLVSLPLNDVSSEQRELVRELIINRVDKRLIALIIQELPEEQFQNILKDVNGKDFSDEEEMTIIAGAIDKIPNFPDKLAGALEELRTELSEDIVDLKNSSSDVDNA
ncbi:MAG: hypothetical protein WC101_00805 [Candidatus Gracilibacteria bacterium]|nr:hypothetical protein [Candidatus Gracilibacteria bacterium]